MPSGCARSSTTIACSPRPTVAWMRAPYRLVIVPLLSRSLAEVRDHRGLARRPLPEEHLVLERRQPERRRRRPPAPAHDAVVGDARAAVVEAVQAVVVARRGG